MEITIDRITLDPNVCNGKPTIKGTRITVQTILEYLKAGNTPNEILSQYPGLEPEDIDSCYEYAIKMASASFYVKPYTIS